MPRHWKALIFLAWLVLQFCAEQAVTAAALCGGTRGGGLDHRAHAAGSHAPAGIVLPCHAAAHEAGGSYPRHAARHHRSAQVCSADPPALTYELAFF